MAGCRRQDDRPAAGAGGLEPDVHDLPALRHDPDLYPGRLDERGGPGAGGGHHGVGFDELTTTTSRKKSSST